MNKIYRLIWNEITRTWAVVAENARACGKRASGAVLLAASGVALAAPPAPDQLPAGGQVVAGSASIGQAGAVMNINQSSQRAAIDWQTFNVGSAASVNFNQPSAASVTLNRVLDSNPSQIFGRISAPGQVFLTNPGGVYFAPGASVDVGALVATTHGISNADFMAGNDRFTRNGATGSIINEGNLSAGLGGYIALLAPEVRNQGVIVAHLGTVALAAGEAYTLQFSGGQLAGIQMEPATLQALVENRQAVEAPGGLIILSALAADSLQGGVVQNSGSLAANSLTEKGGRILLEGDAITLAGSSRLDASGATGGGEVLVGGGWQGSGSMHQATTVTMEQGASIDVSATKVGAGGTAVLWSDVHNAASQTRAYGTILARGGAEGGDGGRIETSGHWLDVGAAPDTGAAMGQGGLWLIDPYNITVVAGGGNTSINAASPFSSSGSSSSLGVDLVNTALSSGNVTIQSGAGGSQAGDITWNTAYTYAGADARTLTLQAHRDIVLNQSIASSGGALSMVFTADSDSNGSGGTVVKGDLTTRGGSITFNGLGAIFSGASAQSLTTAGGAINFNGEAIIANTNGLTLSTAGGNIVFASRLDSGNSYAYNSTLRTWDAARTAIGSGAGGATGSTYLATVTSALEMTAVMATGAPNGWLGGSDAAVEGTWRWVTGPEGLEDSGAGKIFWTTGQSTGATGYNGYSSRYVNWNSGEPNNSNNEDALQMGAGLTGQWNDLPNNSGTLGSIVETNLAASPLSINAGSGTVTFTGVVGGNKALSSLNVTAAGGIAVNGGAVTTDGAQTYTGAVTTGAVTTLTAGSITTSSTVSASGYALTLSTNALTLNGNVSGTGALTIQPKTAGTTIGIAGGTGTLSLPASYFSTNFVNGFSGITVGNATAGAIILGGATTLNDNTTLWSNSNITVAANIAKTSGAASSLTLQADGAIVVNAGVTISDAPSASALSLNLQATGPIRFADNAESKQSVNIHGALYLGGKTGGSTYATGNSTYVDGIYVGNKTALTAGSSIAFWGRGWAGSPGDAGNLGDPNNVQNVSGGPGIAGRNGNAGGSGIVLGNAAAVSGDTIALTGIGSDGGYGGAGGNGGRGGDASGWTTQAGHGGNGAAGGSGSAGGVGIRLGAAASLDASNGIALTGTGGNGGDAGKGGNGGKGGAADSTGDKAGNGGDGANGGNGGAAGGGVSLANGAGIVSGTATIDIASTSGGFGALGERGVRGEAGNKCYWCSAGDPGQYGGFGIAGDAATAFNASGAGYIGAASSGTSSADISFANNSMALGTLAIQSTGALSIRPTTAGTTIGIAGGAGTLSLLASYFSTNFVNGFSGITVGNGLAGAITVGGATTLNDSTTLQTNSTITIGGAVTANENLTLQSNGAITQSQAVGVTGTTSITAGTNAVTLSNTSNNFAGAVSVVSAQNLSLIDSNAMTLGAVASTGTVDVATLTNDLTLTGAISTTNATASAVKLNAGKNAAAGTATGGNIIVSGGSVSTGAGGRATLHTGSVSGSAGLTALVGSGSGRFRYNSDESATNYSTILAALGTGNYAIYREQPTATVTANQTVTYGTAPTLTTSFSGQNGDTAAQAISTVTVAVGGSISASGNYTAGSHDLTPSNAVGKLGYGAISYANGTLTVNQKALTITGFASGNKVYDSNTTAVINTAGTLTGVVSGDSVDFNSGDATFDTKNVGTNKTVTLNGITLSGVNAGNYSIANQTTTASIIAKALTASITASSKAYNGNTTAAPTLTITGGLVGTETVTATGAATFDTKDAGTGKTVTATGNTLADGANGGLASNYSLSTGQTTTADITRALLTVTANAASKTYDGLAYSGGNGVAYSDFVNGETSAVLGGTLAYSGTSQNAINAGSYIITPAGQTSGNYTLSYTNGTLTVNQKALTITGFASDNKLYDGNTTAVIDTAGTLSGVVSGDSVSFTNTGATFNTKDVATATTVTLNGVTLTGTGNANYSYSASTTDASVITAKTLTASITASNKTYNGNTTAAPTFTITGGLVGMETVTATGTATFDSKDVGTGKTVTATSNTLADGANGGLASNYSLGTGQTTTANITAKELSLSGLTASNKVYDGNTSAAISCCSLSGVVSGDSVGFSSGDATFDTKNVGTNKTVTLNGVTLTGANAGNYWIADQATTASITAKALTASITASSKVYNGNTTAAPTFTITGGLVGTETVTATGTAAFDTRDAGTGKTVTATGNTLADGANGGLASNYSLSTGQTTTADITKALLSITANAVVKLYDGAAYTGGNGVIYAGFVNNEIFTVLGGTLGYTGTSQGARDSGSYSITPGGLTSINYTISFVNGVLTINPLFIPISPPVVPQPSPSSTVQPPSSLLSNEGTGTGTIGDSTGGGTTSFGGTGTSGNLTPGGSGANSGGTAHTEEGTGQGAGGPGDGEGPGNGAGQGLGPQDSNAKGSEPKNSRSKDGQSQQQEGGSGSGANSGGTANTTEGTGQGAGGPGDGEGPGNGAGQGLGPQDDSHSSDGKPKDGGSKNSQPKDGQSQQQEGGSGSGANSGGTANTEEGTGQGAGGPGNGDGSGQGLGPQDDSKSGDSHSSDDKPGDGKSKDGSDTKESTGKSSDKDTDQSKPWWQRIFDDSSDDKGGSDSGGGKSKGDQTQDKQSQQQEGGSGANSDGTANTKEGTGQGAGGPGDGDGPGNGSGQGLGPQDDSKSGDSHSSDDKSGDGKSKDGSGTKESTDKSSDKDSGQSKPWWQRIFDDSSDDTGSNSIHEGGSGANSGSDANTTEGTGHGAGGPGDGEGPGNGAGQSLGPQDNNAKGGEPKNSQSKDGQSQQQDGDNAIGADSDVAANTAEVIGQGFDQQGGGIPLGAAESASRESGDSMAVTTTTREGITISLVRAPSDQMAGVVTVSLPKGTATDGNGFTFPLPEQVAAAATNNTQVHVTTASRGTLPSWLRYIPGTKVFVATAVPDGALPIQLVVTIGTQQTTLVISERVR